MECNLDIKPHHEGPVNIYVWTFCEKHMKNIYAVLCYYRDCNPTQRRGSYPTHSILITNMESGRPLPTTQSICYRNSDDNPFFWVILINQYLKY